MAHNPHHHLAPLAVQAPCSRLIAAAVTSAVVTAWVASCGSPQPALSPPLAATTPAVTPSAVPVEGAGLVGSYTFTTDATGLTVNGVPTPGGESSSTTWDLTACGAECAQVTSSLGWSTSLFLSDRMWRASREAPFECASGTSVITVLTYALDARTLTGTMTHFMPCVGEPTMVEMPVSLTAG